MRPLALLPLLLACACSSLSSEDQAKLAGYQRRAALYFDGNRYEQAMVQIERGLELDPDDYKLNAMKGGIMLLRSGDAFGTDHKQLDAATELLARIHDERSSSRHEPYLLLNYGRALQKQGLRRLGEAVRLEGQAARAVAEQDPDAMRAKAKDERAEAERLFTEADALLAELVERGELLRLAHNHRLQIALQRGDDAAFVAEATTYFTQSQKAIEQVRKEIERTNNADYEADQMELMRMLRGEEIGVRQLVAEQHYARKRFDLALEQLDRILEADPRRTVDYYNRGRVLLELGRAEQAKSDFRRFLADPSVPSNSDKAAFALKAIER
jgi:tetratricopeptide (TPR) repeat protein